jgi:protein SCO1/2
MNNKILKIGILVLTLVVPILVYLFLKTFGNNHYRLPTYFPAEINERNDGGNIVYDTIFHNVPDFKVLNQDSQSVSLADYKGKVVVANFFFTRCPGICPQMTSQLTRVQESFSDDSTVKIISFTVDPEYDKPSQLKKFANKFAANPKQWTFAKTETKLDVFNLGFYGFKVPSDTVDKFLHSEKVLLVDKERHIRGFYNGTNKKEIDRLITEIGVLNYEYNREASQ